MEYWCVQGKDLATEPSYEAQSLSVVNLTTISIKASELFYIVS